jgi:vitamin B12 transporter
VGQYELTLDGRLSLAGSVRHDAADLFEDATTYRVGAGYLFDNGLRLRAAAGSGIKNPGFFELFGFIDGRYIGNPNLRPERSEGFELGVERTFAGRITAGAVYFDNRLQDEIFTTFPAPTFVAVPANRDTETEQKGVEAFLNARLGGGWSADFAYTGLRARENGEREVRRAETIASLAVSWRDPGERGGLTAVARYNGEQDDLAFTDPSFVPVRVRLDDYLLLNLNGDFALTPRVSLFGRVENLLDADYEEVFSFVAAGRAAYAGLRARF